MAARIYAVLLHVRDSNLGTILSTVSGSSDLISVSPTKETAQPEGQTRKVHYAGGKRLKGITGPDLALEILNSANRIFTGVEIGNSFVARGFARTSAPSCLYKLTRENRVRNLGHGKYCALGVTVHI